MKVVVYELVENQWASLTINDELPDMILSEILINEFIGISILIGKQLGILSNWDTLAYLHDSKMQKIMRHVSYFLFYHQDTAFVPYKGINALGKIPENSPLNLIQERYDLSLNFQYTDFGEFSLYPSPDYLFFHCMDHLPWSGLSEALYGGFFIKNQEKWNHYFLPYGQYPSDQILSSIKGIIITGSLHSACDNEVWSDEMEKIIRKCLDNNIRVVGICYGHQFLGKILGGEVSKNPSQKAVNKFEELRSINGKKWIVMEIHNDCVSRIPENAETVFSSDSCEIEVFHIEDKVLGIQSHPEFTSYLVSQMAEEFSTPLQDIKNENNSAELREFINEFLRSGVLNF